MSQTTINFTRQKKEALRHAYNAAVKSGSETFMFEGHEIVVGYAKYLLMFLDKNV